MVKRPHPGCFSESETLETGLSEQTQAPQSLEKDEVSAPEDSVGSISGQEASLGVVMPLADADTGSEIEDTPSAAELEEDEPQPVEPMESDLAPHLDSMVRPFDASPLAQASVSELQKVRKELEVIVDSNSEKDSELLDLESVSPEVEVSSAVDVVGDETSVDVRLSGFEDALEPNSDAAEFTHLDASKVSDPDISLTSAALGSTEEEPGALGAQDSLLAERDIDEALSELEEPFSDQELRPGISAASAEVVAPEQKVVSPGEEPVSEETVAAFKGAMREFLVSISSDGTEERDEDLTVAVDDASSPGSGEPAEYAEPRQEEDSTKNSQTS